MKNSTKAILFLVLAIFVMNYSYLDGFLIKVFDDSFTGKVERVIDGDTLEAEICDMGHDTCENIKIRLLGINSPEKGEIYSELSEEFLRNNTLGKDVSLSFGKDKYDLYGRMLAYVFVDGKNVNLESVRKGYSNFYFPSGPDNFYDDIKDAWEECLENNKNLCERSLDECIRIKELDVKKQILILKNVCGYDVDVSGWSVKDEGRKKFVFDNYVVNPFSEITLTNEDWEKDYVWTSSGDSVIIRDDKNLLVEFYNY